MQGFGQSRIYDSSVPSDTCISVVYVVSCEEEQTGKLMEMKPESTNPPVGCSPCSGLVWWRECCTGSSGRCSKAAPQIKAALKQEVPGFTLEQEVDGAATHALGGLVHALHGGSSAIVQEQRLLPVVVVGLQDVPAAQTQVDAEAQVKRKGQNL